MSLYNLVHGENNFASVLLAMLGLSRDEVPRYRDCYWTGEHIAIHTRTGGGNREDYEDGNAYLVSQPTYVRDDDDDHDSTYATFYFTVPEPLQWVIPHLQAEERTPGERWQCFLDRMRDPAAGDDPQVKRALEAMAPVFAKIEAFLAAPELGK